MLSIAICSVNKAYLDAVTKNISQTVSMPYELLVWDNRGRSEGLCRVYNRLAEQAQYPFILFCHEDIIFETGNWAEILIGIFNEQPQTALIGVAGASYKSRYFSGWHTGVAGTDHYRILHEIGGKDIWLEDGSPLVKGATNRVVCIDGVFMAMRREVWQAEPFNEELLKGFHFYDLDLSLRVAKKYDVVVTRDIALRHITVGGDYGDRWVNQAILFHQANKNSLPVGIEQLADTSMEIRIAKNWLDRLKQERISFANKRKWVRLQGLYRHASLWYSIAKFFLYRPSGLGRIHQLLKKS